MFSIFYTLKRILEDHYSNESEDYKRGVNTFLKLLVIGIKKNAQYNLTIKNREQQETIKELEKTCKNYREEIKRLNNKVSSYSLLDIKPASEYFSYSVNTDEGDFEIITNMDKSSFEFCLLNFSYRHSFKKMEECKSKLLTFINNRNVQGFKAFKNKQTYEKFINGKL